LCQKVSFYLLKSDDQPEKFACEKTELSDTTDRSHQTIRYAESTL